MRYSYITGFDPSFYPRPYFFFKCCGIPTYFLRTFIGYLRNPQKRPRAGERRQRGTSVSRGDPLKALRNYLRAIYNCPRQDHTLLLDASLYELLYTPYLSKIEGEGVIVMNPYGVYAAKAVGKKVVVDLMDLWSCRRDVFALNAFDFHALRRADLVFAWSRAIAALLKSMGLRRVEYLPYGLDLQSFDPLTVSPHIFLERYGIDPSVFKVVYSGGMWKVDGRDVLGVEKLLFAFKMVEERRRDVVLLLQTSREVVELAKRVGVKNFIYVERTPKPNDPLRLSMFRSADILVLTASRYPAVYFAERTTLFQYMSSSNAILAEDTPGVRGAVRHGETAYLTPIDSPQKLAEGIIELVRDDGLRKYIGRQARERLEQQYTWQALGKKAKELLQ
ncbi:MAG: glycosyltransferase family 4 protein [Pyrobaculum sp.]|jgi:glycosyltransferase involved in cell wall biosynthesis